MRTVAELQPAFSLASVELQGGGAHCEAVNTPPLSPLPLGAGSASAPVLSPVGALRLPDLRRGWLVALAGLAALLLWDAAGWDLAVVRLFADAHGFALRDHWLTSGLLHQGGRWVATGLAVVLLINALRPLWPGLTRRERWGAVALTAVSLVLIPLMKQGSSTSCPWDLAEFGGVAHYVSHWRFGVGDGGPGHCFPSGHASSAFAFFSLFFMLRRAYPRQARIARKVSSASSVCRLPKSQTVSRIRTFGSPMERTRSSVSSSEAPTFTTTSSQSGRIERMLSTTGKSSTTALRTMVKPETMTIDD